MFDTSGSGANGSFWSQLAMAVGTGLGAFVIAVGRRAGGLARRDPDRPDPADLQAALTALRADLAAVRAAALQDREMLDARLDAIDRAHKIARVNANDIKEALGALLDRLPEPAVRGRRAAPPPAEPPRDAA